MHRSRVHDIVRRVQRRYEYVWHIERLTGFLSIQILDKEFSKLDGIDVRRSEDRLLIVLAGTRIVIVLGEDADLADSGATPEQKKNESVGEKIMTLRRWAKSNC